MIDLFDITKNEALDLMKKFLMTLYILGLAPSYGLSQWLDTQSIKATVLLEREQGDSLVAHGTGFLLYNYESPKHPIVITAAHLLLNRSKIYISLNADSSFLVFAKKNGITVLDNNVSKWYVSGNRIRTEIRLAGSSSKSFVTHQAADIGAFLTSIPSALIDSSGNIVEEITDVLRIPNSGIRLKQQISLGDEVYFVGFPFGIGTVDKIEPLIRSGSIAWLPSSSSDFLLDAISYGGNSGSPVFMKRVLRSPNKVSWDQAYLIGMVVGHLEQSYESVLTLPNPQQAQFVPTAIKLNLGLARCVWIDNILEIVDKAQNLEIAKMEGTPR